jgi:hypothetical protein
VPLDEILDALRTSRIVRRVVFTRFDGVSNSYSLKVRVELANGWLLDCWEHKTPKIRRYSFHVFSDDKMIVRWDNTPHYPNLGGFPHHKHEGIKVSESGDMNIGGVLEELKKMVSARKAP